MSHIMTIWNVKPDEIQKAMHQYPSTADLGNGIRQVAHYLSDKGKACCVFEAPDETSLRRFLGDNKPDSLYMVDWEWQKGKGFMHV